MAAKAKKKAKKKMRLSTAILAGCKLSKPLTHEWLEYEEKRDTDGKLVGATHFAACALGAAVLGYYGKEKVVKDGMYAEDEAYNIWGKQLDNEEKVVAKISKDEDFSNLADLVISLNDWSGWSRQKIAKTLAKYGL